MNTEEVVISETSWIIIQDNGQCIVSKYHCNTYSASTYSAPQQIREDLKYNIVTCEPISRQRPKY
jgi:hypothetical protein